MQLPPRHLYKLMQTNKRFCELCKSEAYWARVALYLIWDDLVLLPISYGKVMESFLESVREKTRDAAFNVDVASSSVEKVLKFWQMLNQDEAGWPGTPIIEGETAFQLVKRIVEDTDGLEKSFKRSVHAADVIRRPGFITASRRARRARSTFLHLCRCSPSPLMLGAGWRLTGRG